MSLLEENNKLRAENESLRKQVADLQEALDNLAPYESQPEELDLSIWRKRLLQRVRNLEQAVKPLRYDPLRQAINQHVIAISRILRGSDAS